MLRPAGATLVIKLKGGTTHEREARGAHELIQKSWDHPGVLDIRGRRDFSRFDPSPGEASL